MKTPLYITNTLHTLVKGSIISNKQRINGFFLLDSACSNNILNKHIGIQTNSNGQKSKLFVTMNSEQTIATSTNLVISIEGIETEEEMSVIDCNHELFQTPNFPVLGILGISYLVTHKMCIDYEKMSMYNVPANRDMSNFKTRCPFAYGVRNYGVAVVGIGNGIEDNVMMTLLDTGSNLNVICKQALSSYPFNKSDIDKIQDVAGINSSTAMKGSIVDFSLVIIEGENISYKPMKNEFHVNEKSEYLLREEGYKQVEAVIGATFIISNKCILDFSTGNMYSVLWG